MLDGLGSLPLGALTPAGLLGLLIILIALGKLVPRRTMDDIVEDRNQWREAHRTSEEARVELQQQVQELLEHSRATDAFLRAIPLGVARAREEQDDP